MSFFNKLKEGFNSGRAELTKQVSRFKNKKIYARYGRSLCSYRYCQRWCEF